MILSDGICHLVVLSLRFHPLPAGHPAFSTKAISFMRQLRQFPERMSWNYLFILSCSLCFPLCFTSEMKPFSANIWPEQASSESTFIFSLFIIRHAELHHMRSSPRTTGYRYWILFTDILGMATLMSEITTTPEVRASLLLSPVSRGRIITRFYPSSFISQVVSSHAAKHMSNG